MSQDFKNALDAEISLEEPATRRPTPLASSALDAQLTEEMRRSAEAEAWGGSPPGSPTSPQPPKEAITVEAAAAPVRPPPGKLPDLSQLDD